MPHRVFLAIPISLSLQNEVTTWERNFQNLPVRWLKGKNLHITLIPPWETNDIVNIVTLLNGLKSSVGKIELQFTSVTFGPNPREPRLILAEGETMNQLSEIRSQLYETLKFPPESRFFKLHLTLARFRPENFSTFPMQTLNETVDWHDTATSFVLMESHLLPTGAEYKILSSYPL
ncbi:MAG: RNA 2',3'-cyclic phosphodiesterase [Patescibacteria group bacterium]